MEHWLKWVNRVATQLLIKNSRTFQGKLQFFQWYKCENKKKVHDTRYQYETSFFTTIKKKMFFLTYIWLSHDQLSPLLRGHSHTQPMLITSFFTISAQRSSRASQRGSVSKPSRGPSGFVSVIFRFLLSRLNPLGHSSQTNKKWEIHCIIQQA